MSIAKMSEALKAEFISRMEQVVKSQYKENTTDYISKVRSRSIRKATDKGTAGHESLVSAGSFKALVSDMHTYLDSLGVLTEVQMACVQVISDTKKTNYESFVEYVKDSLKLFDEKVSAEVEGEFTYTGGMRDTTQEAIVQGVVREGDSRNLLLLKNINIGKLVDLFVEYLSSKVVGVEQDVAKKYIRSLLNAGHLTGAFTARFAKIFGLTKTPTGVIRWKGAAPDAEITKAEKQLNAIVSLVTDADFLSSNLLGDIALFAATDKRLYKEGVELSLTTEIQLAVGNQDIGRKLASAGIALSQLTRALKLSGETLKLDAADKAIQSLYTGLTEITAEVQRLADLHSPADKNSALAKELDRIVKNANNIDTILKTPGSRSVLQHIEYVIASMLKGEAVQEERSVAKAVSKIQSKKTIKKTAPKVKAKPSGIKANTSSILRNIDTGRFTSLSSLQGILNAALSQQVIKNMGNGNRKDILNYRSGRFAESAKVERMSMSKEGMITAFYSYMKYPYQTFEPGFAQGSPNSRNPRLLISKSIREIAAEQVGNRLRAVLV